MSWWDFLSDFTLIVRDLLQIPVLDYIVPGADTPLTVTIGSLLASVLVLSVILFYFVPRR